MPIKGLTYEQWYNTIPKEKNDTTNYNLRRAYELAPEQQLKDFASNPEAHLMSAYENPETGDYEFVKSRNHPTVNLELDWYNSDKGKDFRSKYDLDTSGEYYQYKRKKNDKPMSNEKRKEILNGYLFSDHSRAIQDGKRPEEEDSYKEPEADKQIISTTSDPKEDAFKGDAMSNMLKAIKGRK